MALPAHLFASTDGGLYDTRVPHWSRVAPLRAIYRQHFPTIRNMAELKATLRAGPYAWPGGYPLYFIMADGEAMSFESVRANLREIAHDTRVGCNDWRVVACSTNWEDSDLLCCHSGKPIESAYGHD